MVNNAKKILIVEDERAIARAFELKLVNGGFDTRIAANGEEALAMAEEEAFDLIFLDLIMPKMTGFQVLEALKARKSAVPVVVTSSLRQEADVNYARSLGARDYFVKSDVAQADIVAYAKNILQNA